MENWQKGSRPFDPFAFPFFLPPSRFSNFFRIGRNYWPRIRSNKEQRALVIEEKMSEEGSRLESKSKRVGSRYDGGGP